jgi:hypothetical protein
VLVTLSAVIPGARLVKLTDYVTGDDGPWFDAATELRLHGGGELLATDRAAYTSRHLIAALQPLHPGETIQFRPHADELHLSRMLEMAATAVDDHGEPIMRSPRSLRAVPHRQRLVAVAVLGRRELRLPWYNASVWFRILAVARMCGR